MSDHFQIQLKPEYAFHLGVERERWTVDPVSGRLVSVTKHFLPNALLEECGIKPELPAQQIEDTVGPCYSLGDVEASMSSNDQILAQLGNKYGFALSCNPMPPQDDFELEVFPSPRYLRISQSVDSRQLRNGWITGMHVHRGMPDLPTLFAEHNHMREMLPVLLAFSAASPGKNGEKSMRFLRYMEMCPDFVPPFLKDFDRYEYVARKQGFYTDPGRCWWGVRPNNRHGTLEVRVMDTQQSIQHCLELIALLVGLARLRTETVVKYKMRLEWGDSKHVFEPNRVHSSEEILKLLYAVARGDCAVWQFLPFVDAAKLALHPQKHYPELKRLDDLYNRFQSPAF